MPPRRARRYRRLSELPKKAVYNVMPYLREHDVWSLGFTCTKFLKHVIRSESKIEMEDNSEDYFVDTLEDRFIKWKRHFEMEVACVKRDPNNNLLSRKSNNSEDEVPPVVQRQRPYKRRRLQREGM